MESGPTGRQGKFNDFFAKQDLPYAETLDEVTVLGSVQEPAYSLGVFGDSQFYILPKPTDGST